MVGLDPWCHDTILTHNAQRTARSGRKTLSATGQGCLLLDSTFSAHQGSCTREIPTIWLPKRDLRDEKHPLACQCGWGAFHKALPQRKSSRQSMAQLAFFGDEITPIAYPIPSGQTYKAHVHWTTIHGLSRPHICVIRINKGEEVINLRGSRRDHGRSLRRGGMGEDNVITVGICEILKKCV